MAPTREHRRKVAIIGSGCAGLGAAWALRNTDYEVHVFEKSHKLGGHTNTQPFHAGGTTVQVDTGFIVMNAATYPNFLNFLKEVGVDPVDSEMTFAVSRDNGAFEWSGEAKGIFAQRRNLFRLRHWRMIFDIVRFNQFALDILALDDGKSAPRFGASRYTPEEIADMTIGDYLEREGYSDGFRDDYLVPMTAAVWSTSPDKASLDFPAQTLIRFMWNHHLLSTIAQRPLWLTIPGGSRQYIEAVIKQFPKKRLHVHTACEVANVLRPTPNAKNGDGTVNVSWINAKSGRIEVDSFDHVILACHGDEVLPLLTKHGSLRQSISSASGSEKPKKSSSSKSNGFSKLSTHGQYVTEEELEIFSAFQTTQNVCYLHSDLSLMPKRRAVWTSWNYLISSQHPSSEPHPAGVSLTYNMNILQHISRDDFGHVLVTMNPEHPPEPASIQGKFHYRHPLYTVEAVRAQDRLSEVQNTRGVSYCGAWTKYGFHEDGFSSGLKVAIEHLGAKLPFEFVDSTYSRGHKPHFGWQDSLVRLCILGTLVFVRATDWFVALPVISVLVVILSGICSLLLSLIEFAGLI